MDVRIGSNSWEIGSADAYFVVKWDEAAHRAYLVGDSDAASAASLTGAALRVTMPDGVRARILLLSHFEIKTEIEEACTFAGASLVRCVTAPIGSTYSLIDVDDIHALLHVVGALWDHCYFLLTAGGAWSDSFAELDLVGLETGTTQLHVSGDDGIAAGTYMDPDVVLLVAPRSIDETRWGQILARFSEVAKHFETARPAPEKDDR